MQLDARFGHVNQHVKLEIIQVRRKLKTDRKLRLPQVRRRSNSQNPHVNRSLSC